MKEYVERGKILDQAYYHSLSRESIYDAYGVDAVDEDDIKAIPAADVVEVRHGRWISVAADVLFRCSLCDCEVSTSWEYDQDGMFDYCPCCGAKMDGGETYA